MHLDCGVCLVRDWRAADKSSLVRFANNRNVWRNLAHRFPHPYTDADADAWFSHLAKRPRRTSWAIEVDGLAVGGIGADIDEGIWCRNANFGYWLGEPYWGRGIMTAAVRNTARYALEHFDLMRLESRCSNGIRHPCAYWRSAAFSARACCARASPRMGRSSMRRCTRAFGSCPLLRRLPQPSAPT